MRRLIPLLLLGSCATQRQDYGGNVAVGAVVMSALAVASAVASKASGGCYASCPTGTACNAKTGFCDVLPCRGLCGPEQECDTDGPIDFCGPRHAVEMKIQTQTDPGSDRPTQPITPQ